MKTMDLGLWDIDNISNRDRITELVREKKPAFIVGSPRTDQWDIFGLYEGYVKYRFEKADGSCMSSLEFRWRGT